MPTRGSGSYWADGYLTFRNVTVPKGATINKAIVRFTAKAGTGTVHTVTNDEDDVYSMIFGNDVDDSDPPTDTTTYAAKTLTDNCRNWDNIAHWTDETTYDSPDISCIIQEIVDRSGWSSGNDLSLYFQNNYSTEVSLHDLGRRAYDYGTDSSKAPQLLIYWTYDATGSGGLLLGGSSPVVSGLVGSGGLLLGGTAPRTGTYIETPAGGMLLGGTATATSIETATGGMLLGGSAPVAIAYSYLGSGGLVLNSPHWLYRKLLNVPAASIGEDIDKFYLPVATTILANDTGDVEFTTLSGQALYHELREYDSDTGQLWAFVKMPLDADSDNQFYLYYGDNS